MAYGYVHRSAPASVRTVTIAHYLGGVTLLVLAALMVVATRHGFGDTVPELVRTAALPGAAVFAVAGLLVIAIGRKLRRGRQWARVLVLVLSVLSAAGTLYDGLLAAGTRSNAFGLVFPVLYLILLNTPAARAWFREGSHEGRQSSEPVRYR